MVKIEKYAKEISKDLLSVNCFKRACVLQKKFAENWQVYQESNGNLNVMGAIKKDILQFYCFGLSMSDKVSYHHYEYLYGMHLGPYRDEKITFLEIGIPKERREFSGR